MKTLMITSRTLMAVGLTALTGICYAQTQTGNYITRQLSPNTTPSAAVGNDLLLAENAAGPRPAAQGVPSVPAESWTTTLEMTETYDPSRGSGSFTPDVLKKGFFDGSGPTGYYANGTIGTGQHTENTLADIHAFYKPRNGLTWYVYAFQVTSYDNTGKTIVTNYGSQPQPYSN